MKPRLSPTEASAFEKIGCLSPETAVSLACGWIQQGLSSDSLLELAASHEPRPTWCDYQTVFRRAMREIGVPDFSPEQSLRLALKYHLEQFVATSPPSSFSQQALEDFLVHHYQGGPWQDEAQQVETLYVMRYQLEEIDHLPEAAGQRAHERAQCVADAQVAARSVLSSL
ncbi:hypothetical protein [Maricaulis sp.]|uniref:hypothetical protein n=1 Tax=Maricaulis sp. TaxID=1486257 RepID=UPI002B2779A6|nr:hypothetical protein [Maricaulis sp.]